MVTRRDDAGVIAQWRILIKKSERQRLSPERFEAFVKILKRKGDVSGSEIARLVLEGQAGTGAIDPLVVSFIKCLLRLRIISGPELLAAVHHFSYTKSNALENDSTANGKAKKPRKPLSSELEEILLDTLTLQCAAHEFSGSTAATAKTLTVLTEWVNALVELDHQTIIQGVSQGFHETDARIIVTREALGRFIVGLSESPQVSNDLDSDSARDLVKQFGKALSAFTPLLGTISMPLANRLEILQQSHDALQPPVDPSGFGEAAGNPVDLGEIHIESIADRAATHTRAHLVVFLDFLLSGLPRINDDEAMAYIQSCFKADHALMSVNLIASSFDVLAVASGRGDSPDKLFLYRAFIFNKLPIFMNSMISLNFNSFMPLNFPLLISQAFGRLEYQTALDPGLAVHVDGDLITQTKRDFLSACELNGIITDSDVGQLADDVAIKSHPVSSRANRVALSQECQSNPNKLEQIVKELDKANGDAGEYVSTLVQSIGELCSSRDTMTLRTICLLLCTRPHAIDTIFLFSEPGPLLGPLSQLLDEWKYDDHQGEYQPVYEEFSACLLFFLICVDRYDLDTSRMDLQPDNKFIPRILDLSLATRPLHKLDEEQSKQLAGWAKSLFDLEAISDDVMSICPPQDFYKLVPTIFAQTFMARQLDIISIKALESGTELLLEPFLLPCMILGVQYLEESTWKSREQTSVVVPFLRKLIQPSSKSGEALALHNAVLSVTKPCLKRIIQRARNDNASKTEEYDQLLESLNSIEQNAGLHEPLSPSISNSTTTLNFFRSNFDSLCSWSMPASLVASVPLYSHRSLLGVLRLNGAPKLVDTIVEALVTYAETGLVDIALDIATAIICAATMSNRGDDLQQYPARMHPRQALEIARDGAAKFMSREPVRAELIVLLHRRVETQMTAVQNSQSQGLVMPASDLLMNMAPADNEVNIDMMNMNTFDLTQDDPQIQAAGQDVSAIDFVPDSQAMNLPEDEFSLPLDESFVEQVTAGTGLTAGNTGVTDEEDVWSGLVGFDDGMDFT